MAIRMTSPSAGISPADARWTSLGERSAAFGNRSRNSVAANDSVQAMSGVKSLSHQLTFSSAEAACSIEPNGPGFATIVTPANVTRTAANITTLARMTVPGREQTVKRCDMMDALTVCEVDVNTLE